MNRIKISAVLIVALLSCLYAGAAQVGSGYKFDPSDTSCGGYPKLAVTTFQGSCLGLVVDKGLRFPRKILELEPGRFLITDMGAWDPVDRGVLWELDLRAGQKNLIQRASGLLLPHDIQFGPDGNIYIGERGRITRWSTTELLGHQPVKGQAVISNILGDLEGQRDLHPLMKFAFGKSPVDFGDLYVNVGAPTDACVKDAPQVCKVNAKAGLIRRFKFHGNTGASKLASWDSQGVIWATGLRNSMGLLSHPSGTLLQTENSRDFPSSAEPFDEINLIQPHKNYGWPYCYDFTAASPEWKNINCAKDYEPPYLLVPPHAAPLDMLYYDGVMFPELQGHLLMAWHGYRATGSRIVSYATTAEGLPVLSDVKDWSYNETSANGLLPKAATPKGGNLRSSKYTELVSIWNQKEGLRPSGAPVGLTVASDGSVFIVEDKNHSIVILTKSTDAPYQDAPSDTTSDASDVPAEAAKMIATPPLKAAYQHLNQEVFQPVCASCHEGIKGSEQQALQFLIREKWVLPGNLKSPLLLRVLGADGLQRMPFGGSLKPSQITDIRNWIGNSRP